ncbi:MAG: hypothetical protein DWQ08_14960 [Proteobacteria bacterium]|nr:MAG: hypothetical protein DWQ08_14960 [Pseudomonadota bacterium]
MPGAELPTRGDRFVALTGLAQGIRRRVANRVPANLKSRLRRVWPRRRRDALHLCVVCRDVRHYDYVRHSVGRAHAVFDVLHIIVGSQDELIECLETWSPRVRVTRCAAMSRGPAGTCCQLKGVVPNGAWCLLLESNEIPSRFLLDHIRPAVRRLAAEGYRHARLPVVEHVDGKRCGPEPDDLPRIPEELAAGACDTRPRLVRNIGSGAFATERDADSRCEGSPGPAYLPLYLCRYPADVSRIEAGGSGPRPKFEPCPDSCCAFDIDFTSECDVLPRSVPRLYPDWEIVECDGFHRASSVRRQVRVSLNESAAAVIACIDGRRSVDVIAGLLSAVEPASTAKVREGVKAVVGRLLRDGIVSVRTPPPVQTALPGGVPPDVRDAVARELEYWRHAGAWRDEAMQQCGLPYGIVVASFDNGGVEIRPRYEHEHRVTVLAAYLDDIAAGAPDISGEFAFQLGDMAHGSVQYPVLGFSKYFRDRETVVLIPDYYFMAGYGGLTEEVENAAHRISWRDKIAEAIWRGAPTGQHNSDDTWRKNLRIRLCFHARRNRDILDAGLTSFAQTSPGASESIRRAGLVRNRLTEYQQMYYKYLLNVDGNSCSWSGAYWKLLSNSLMIQVVNDDPQDLGGDHGIGYRQWYHHWLENGRHYLGCEMSDLREVIEWARDHDRECEEIAGAATSFARSRLTPDVGKIYTTEVLRELSRIRSRR